MASIQTYNDTIHTFIERKDYKGLYLPGYVKHHSTEPFNKLFDKSRLNIVDHIVGN